MRTRGPAVARKELREIRRDPITLWIAGVVPVVLLGIFGYALRLDFKEIPMAVLDFDRSRESAALVEAFINTGDFAVREHPGTERELRRLLDGGRARLGLVIPRGFGRDLAAGRVAPVQTLIDGSLAATAAVIRNEVAAVTLRYTVRQIRSSPAGERLPLGPRVESRVWYNPGLRSEVFVVPGLYAVRHRPATVEAGRALLERGEARLVVVLPRGYEGELARLGTSGVQLLVDGSNSILALNAAGQAQRIILRSWQDLLAQYQAARPAVPRVENRVRIWYNPDLRFAFEQVLTSIALAAFMVAVIIPTALIVKEKESGTIEQVLVTPLRPAELILAKTVPVFVIGTLALGPSTLIARLFGLPFRGNPLTFTVVSAALLVSLIATGVLIAASVRTIQQALLVAFFVTVPILFLSGTVTPVENVPPALQAAARLSPMRYYEESLPAIVLKGAGLDVLWPQLLWLLGLGAALFALASAVFRRRLV